MMTLQIYLTTKPGQGAALENLYHQAYVPAITKQVGFRSTTLLRAYESETRYEIDITFETEAQRQAWADGAEHAETWPRIVALCTEVSAQGFDILA
ncbi:MAG: antibiotic biosynthesis monooxygenase family protein [Chloroflexota bacterium]